MPAPAPRPAAPAAELQRARVLAAAIAVACEHGVGSVTVSRVIKRAHVSRRTFYELFANREDCLCAAYEEIAGVVLSHATLACEAQSRWVDRIRAGLQAALELFDEQPQLARLCFVEAPAAGEQTLRSRAKLVRAVAERLDRDYATERSSRVPPAIALAGEAFIGGVLEILHTRLLAPDGARLAELSSQLTAIVVLPYLGPAAARRELARTNAPPAPSSSALDGGGALLSPPPMRLTHRTLLVLSVISDSPGLSNRAIGDRAEIKDQGQVSKLLSRLGELGLIANSGAGQAHGAANAWRLDHAGAQLIQSVGPRSSVSASGPERVEGVTRE
ncbi:MAG TPA: TetR/AcrR family transcriptional regulator [Solirubrobacteraceae bacterium]|nr:TetR/AcrR family transcriptional regulator [Solirubrobacteraceae bacterium]